jgi:LCP family protein required for cell wall assembly
MSLADDLENTLASRMRSSAGPTRPRRRRTLTILGSGLLLVLAAVTVVAVFLTHSLVGDLTVLPGVVTATGPARGAPVDVLLLGVDDTAPDDSWADGATGVRSDTVMLVHVSADRSSVQVISLLRDTWVDVPGHGEAKLNAAFSWGGAQLTVRTVEGLLGVEVDHVAVIDFSGLGAFADALGGVPVESPVAFDSRNMPGFSYTAGPNVVAGDRAVAFVRERYAFPDADFQRVRNQASFVRGAVTRLHEVATTQDLQTFAAVDDSSRVTAAVDSELTALTAVEIGWSLRAVDGHAVTTATLPTASTDTRDGQSVVMQDVDGIARLRDAIRQDDVAEFISDEGSRE